MNRVTRDLGGVLFGRSARWWDSEIKKSALRRALYRKDVSDLWAEYCQLRREVT